MLRGVDTRTAQLTRYGGIETFEGFLALPLALCGANEFVVGGINITGQPVGALSKTKRGAEAIQLVFDHNPRGGVMLFVSCVHQDSETASNGVSAVGNGRG